MKSCESRVASCELRNRVEKCHASGCTFPDLQPATRNLQQVLLVPTRNSQLATRNRSSGFTLLEVLVAIAIVGVAVTAILELFSSSLRAISASEDHVRASLAAEARMREVLDDNLDEKGWSEVTSDGYRVDGVIKKVHTDRAETIGASLFQVDLTLSWKRGIRNRTIRLSTFKAVHEGEDRTSKAAEG